MADLTDVIQSHINEMLQYMYTSLPAVVTKVHIKDKMTVVDVKPLINRISQEGYADQEAILENIPVKWPRGGGFHLTCPIDVGDTVDLNFCMRAAGDFKQSDGTKPITPSNKRLHNLSDSFATPTALTYKQDSTVDSEALSLGSDSMEIRITKEGTIELGKGATESLVLGKTFLELYNGLSVPTGVGPSGPPLTPMVAETHLSQKVTTK